MDILQQLGELVLGSLPTVALFFITLALYSFLVYRPLTRVLAERHARTKGAIEQARLAIAAAEAKTAEYEGALRAARIEVATVREQRVHQWNMEREQVLIAARERAQLKVQAAKLALEQSAQQARLEIEKSADRLAGMVLAAVMPEVSR